MMWTTFEIVFDSVFLCFRGIAVAENLVQQDAL